MIELSLPCDLNHTDDTFYFAFDPPRNLIQIRAPDNVAGEGIGRSLLKSIYTDDVYFDLWYERTKATGTLPVFAFTQHEQIYIVAVADRPGANAQKLDASHINPIVFQDLARELRTRFMRVDDCVDQVNNTHCDVEELAPAYAPAYAPANRLLILRRRPPTTRLDHQGIVDGFLQLLEQFVEKPCLEFLTPGAGAVGVDHKFKLTLDPAHKDFAPSSQFIAQHQGQFAAVVMHTCPFLFMLDILPTVATLLRKDGQLLWTTRPDGPYSVGLLSKETFAKIVAQFDQKHGDKWHVYFNDFKVTAPGMFVKA